MAYAAITCLMRTIYQSMQITGCDLQPFYEKLESLRAILEKSSNISGDLEALTSLEAEIADLAYTTEDMVDSESRNVFLAQNVEERGRTMWELFYLLEQALECMKQWMTTWDRCNSMRSLKAKIYSLASLPEHAIEWPENIMVGHETEFELILDQLAGGGRGLEVVSIVGMGGIGKTTLATKLYCNPHIMSHFDILAKATVSQDHCVRNVLLGLLSTISDEPDDQLADQLQKLLKRKRYLVFIDDIWTTRAWDDIQLCFPDCNNGSRILLTTRNVEVAEHASSGKPPNQMRLMNFNESWSLFYEKVFAKDSFSPEFERLGKQIALKCRGLPLLIVVIGGLLSKIGKTFSEWQSVSENVSSAVSTNVDVQCMRVLALSYHYLPHHLKPCFLYFAIFSEDKLIYSEHLVELWEMEGFLKLEEMKSIEEVAEKCLKDLSDRSLISISHLGSDGKIDTCGMHDVIREFCLREAQNMNFVSVLGGKRDQISCVQSMQCSSTNRGRISIHNVEELARCHNGGAHSIICTEKIQCSVPELPFKLVRVLDLGLISYATFPSGILSLIHLRYLSLHLCPLLKQYLESEKEVPPSIMDIPSSISSLCFLQTFKLFLPYSSNDQECPFILPSEVLSMPQLRHLYLGWNYLRCYKPTEKSLFFNNLQCLSGLNPWYCTGSFFRLFPNLKKLQICGVPEDFRSRKELYDFRCLDQLAELNFYSSYPVTLHSCFLESTTPSGSTPEFPLRFQKKMPHAVTIPTLLLPPPDAFPQNLKNLAFGGTFLPWKDLTIVGQLPKLESLKLSYNACTGQQWEVAESFPRLKFLHLIDLDIQYWRASRDHFPSLEQLFLDSCSFLDSIPQDFAEITTLELIDLIDCAQSVVYSAKQIQQDIQDVYGGSIKVHIRNTL
ncbi:unnamed protein product [Withania somnifera]